MARAEKRLAIHDEERITLEKQLEDGKQRLLKLREEVSQSPAPAPVQPTDWGAPTTVPGELSQWLEDRTGGSEGRFCQGGRHRGSRIDFTDGTRCRAVDSVDMSAGNDRRRARVAGSPLVRGDSLRTECCFGCREALVLERERQVVCEGSGSERQRTQVLSAGAAGRRDCGHYHGHGIATPNQMKRVGMSFAGWMHSQSTPMTLMSHNPAHLVK